MPSKCQRNRSSSLPTNISFSLNLCTLFPALVPASPSIDCSQLFPSVRAGSSIKPSTSLRQTIQSSAIPRQCFPLFYGFGSLAGSRERRTRLPLLKNVVHVHPDEKEAAPGTRTSESTYFAVCIVYSHCHAIRLVSVCLENITLEPGTRATVGVSSFILIS